MPKTSAADKKLAKTLASRPPSGPATSNVTDPAEDVVVVDANDAEKKTREDEMTEETNSPPPADEEVAPVDAAAVDAVDAAKKKKEDDDEANDPTAIAEVEGMTEERKEALAMIAAKDEEAAQRAAALPSAKELGLKSTVAKKTTAKKSIDDLDDYAFAPPRESGARGSDASFVHYAKNVYCQSARRPGGSHFDLTFVLRDPEGNTVAFADCDATGQYAPGKEQPILRSKIAVARFLERDGMSTEDLARMDDALKEARALAEIEAVAIAADTVAVASRSLPPRRAASAKPVKYAYDSEDDSDLLASDDDAAEGDEEESEDDLDVVEKIVYCAELDDVDANEVEELGSDAAKEVMAKHLAAKAHAAAAKSPASKAKSPKGGGGGGGGGGKKTASASALLYCVKWEGCGYRRRSWETAGDLDALKSGKPKLVSLKRRHAQNPDLTTEPFPAQYLVVDRVIDKRDAPVDDEDDEEEEETSEEDAVAKKKTSKKKAPKKKKGESSEEEEDDDDDDDADDAEPSHEYLVKWRGLGYGEATWETAASLSSDVDAAHVAAYEKRNDLKAKRAIHATAAENQKNGAKLPAKPTPPEFKNNMALREYQVTSFEWMVGNYRRRQNVILGDEMGLGKTAQCIAVMEHVRTKHLLAPRPFLVVAPLTTLGHWKREMEKWTDMNVVTLDGTARDREVCQETEFYFESRGAKGPAKFDVLLISFETARRLTELIAEFQWALCVVDEAHKLKDVNSMTTQAVMDIGYDWLLLLTGTPIQNNVKELFGMMHVLDPVQYPSWEEFQNEHCGGQDREVDADQVMQLRKVLQPRMLRRMKEDVETIPAKEEIVVWVELTAEQRAYYRMIYEKQVHVLMEGNKSKNVPQLRNLCMELRKVCNHPFLCDGVEQDYVDKKTRAAEEAAAKAAADAAAAGVAPPTPPAPPTSLDLLTGASGKMVLVAKLLAKLKSEGKKVLIFSQFTIVLDILEDYLGMMKYEYERLDGSTSQADRQAGIDRFNQDGQGFVYLLSTRAGGMGITLTAADTAIIYDSDWNPQNDLQAMARCHRIGQTKEVKVYRLVTKATYEQSLFETSAKKYGLDEAVLGGGGDVDDDGAPNGKGGGKKDAEKINQLLKYGVHGALRDASGEEAAAFANEDIDQILGSRAEHRSIGNRAGNTFSTATFAVTTDGGDAVVDAEKFWEEMLPDAVGKAKEEAANYDPLAHLTLGPRKRNKVHFESYKEGAAGMVGKKIRRRRGGDDDDFDGSEDDSEEGDRETRGAKRASKKKKKAAADDAKKELRANAWRDHELKSVEDAIYTFGPGRDRRCVRAAIEADISRPFAEVQAVALALLDFIEKIGVACGARHAEIEAAAAAAGPIERCHVCASQKKGRCGTETAPRSCLNLPKHIADAMDEGVGEDGGDGRNAVPVGMARSTWEAALRACDESFALTADAVTEEARVALARVNVWKRLASGWQRATKCLKERAALSEAIEVEKSEEDIAREAAEIATRPAEYVPPMPEEKDDATFRDVVPVIAKGNLVSWWNESFDADLLRGSLRHGFSPWSQDALDEQFEALRADETLSFAKAGLAPCPEKAEDDAEDGTSTDAGKTMPPRDTLKRRLLRLLEYLIKPPAMKPKKPTKAELAAERAAAAAEARKARDAMREEERLKKEAERAEKEAQREEERERREQEKAEEKERKEQEKAEEKERKEHEKEEAKARKEREKAEERARREREKAEHKTKKDEAKKKMNPFKLAKKAASSALCGGASKKTVAKKRPADPGATGVDGRSPPAKKQKKKEAPDEIRAAATVYDEPARGDVPSGKKQKVSPPSNSRDAGKASDSDECGENENAAPAGNGNGDADADATAFAAATKPTAPAFNADGDDPLTSLVLPRMNGTLNKTPASSSATAAGGFKKGKGGAAAAAAAGQRSLFGFFAKTPAPAAAGERPRTVATPTTGGFA